MIQQFRHSDINTKLLKDYASIARCNQAAAVRILGMLLPSDGTYYSYLSSRTLEILAELAQSDMDSFEWVLSHTKLPDEITPAQRPLIVLLALETVDPPAAATLQSLPWVQDVATSTHDVSYNYGYKTRPRNYSGASAVRLAEMALVAEEAFRGLLDKPWMQDDYASIEYAIIEEVFLIGLWDDTAAVRLLEMPFLETLDGQGGATAAILGILHDLLTRHPRDQDPEGSAVLEQLLVRLKLPGDITSAELGAIALEDLGMRIPGARSAVEALPWIRDGTDPSEQWAVIVLRREALRIVALEAFRTILAKPWVQDGLASGELQALADIFQEARSMSMHRMENAAVVIKILEMPFLDKIDDLDLSALRALAILRDQLPQILAHPELDGGITDDQTDVVAIMGRFHFHPHFWEVVLDSQQTLVKKRSIILPLAGEVALSVVWPGDPAADARASWVMDRVEHAVRTHEAFMGVPYPKPYAILLVADDPHTEVIGAGALDGFARIDPLHYSDERLIYHELAHAYWHSRGGGSWVTWIVEGGAIMLELASVIARHGSAMPDPLNSCSLANNISELVNDLLSGKYPGNEVYESGCNYHLGSGMFLELYHSLGDKDFREGFTKLYLHVQDPVTREECEDRHGGYCHIQAAFVDGAPSSESAAIAEEIIDRRYHGPVREE